MLDAEVGVVPFQGLGLTYTFQSNSHVPFLPLSYNLLWQGVARSFTTPAEPDIIVINYGTNDFGSSDANVTTAMGQVLSGLLAATTTSKIAVLRPFNGSKASAISAAVTAASSSRVSYLDTTGIFSPNTTNSLDNTRPTASAHLGQIAPALASRLAPLLNVDGPGTAVTTLSVVQTDGTTPLSDFECWVTSDALGLVAVSGVQSTDTSGNVKFRLTTGSTYYLRGHGGGYQIGGTLATPAVAFVA